MRHRVYGKKLGKNKNEREALFKSLVQELVLHGTITTSESKAKAIKGLVDKIINSAKNKNTQRLLQAYFYNKLLQERLVKEIVPKMGARNSGYTSIVRMGTRLGDQTMMVKMSLIGAEKLKPLEKATGNRVQVTGKKTEPVSKARALRALKKVAAEKKVSVRKPARKLIRRVKKP